jgi:glycosyltransferase involved in cell wall biosynthesis
MKFKKILNIGPGYEPVLIIADSFEELEVKYETTRKEILKVTGISVKSMVTMSTKESGNKKATQKETKRNVLTKQEQSPNSIEYVDKSIKQVTVSDTSLPKLTKDKEAIWPSNSKPKICLINDVRGWAWDIKSNYLMKYLSDDFNFLSVAVLEDRIHDWSKIKADIYFTYGWDYYGRIGIKDKNKIVSGITAHKDKNIWNNGVLRTLKTCAHVHANSLMLKTALEEAGIKNIYYVPNGVDEVLFREIKPVNILPENILRAGHVGKLGGIGGKGQKEYLEPAAKEAGVIWKGHYNNYRNRIPHQRMVDFYQEIDVFCVASVTDGTPNGALEAAACARPIISNHIGNMPEFIVDGYNGFLINRDVKEYVEKLKLLNEDKELCYEMGQNARKTIEENWTWKIQAENYRRMFWDILGKI